MPDSRLEPTVLYPAPGLPHFIVPHVSGTPTVAHLSSLSRTPTLESRASRTANDGTPSLDVIVCTGLRDPAIRAWAEGLRLLPSFAAGSFPLRAVRCEEIDRARPPASVATLLQVDSHSEQRLIRIRLGGDVGNGASVGGGQAPRFALYDLMHRGTVLRRRCVAIDGRPRSGRLALAFASDLHVAAIWDTIDAALAQYAADLQPHYLHPGRLLRRFVGAANELAARGELDLVVFGGDLVDHVRPDRHVQASGSNVDHFLELLEDLTVPCCMIPGNHDYRLHPWRPRIYPYASVAIPRQRAAAALRRAGLWDALPLRRGDLRALQTRDESGRCALAEHLAKLAPAVDYRIDLPEMSLTLLSTGRDILARWRTLERSRWSTLVRSLPSSWEHPDSEGLDPQQIAMVASALGEAKGAAIFYHAPLLHPEPSIRVESRLARLDPGDHDGAAAAAAFERRLFGSGLRHGVFFRNPGALIRVLAATQRSAAVFSGHVHQCHAMRFDPVDLSVRTMELPWRPGGERSVGLFNAPALGQTAMTQGAAPGYLLATFASGRLEQAWMTPLSTTAAASA